MRTAGQFCRREVATVTRSDSLAEAARRMRDAHVGSLVVVDEGPDGARVPVGVVTDRDILLALLAPSDRAPPSAVGDVIAERKLVFAFAGDDLSEAIDRMRVAGVRRLPVLDPRGSLEGIITFDDVLEALAGSTASLVALIAHEQERERAHAH